MWMIRTSSYVVGTDSGNIHKCSTAYSEQYLESFSGHSGSIHRLKYAPRCHCGDCSE